MANRASLPTALIASAFSGAGALRTYIWGIFTVALLVLIVVPLPHYMLDLAITLNFLCAFLIIIGSLHAVSFIDLSTFPTLLLISTVFRLVTSVATCRAVLSGDNPGAIVRQFGEAVASGSLAVGITLFLIISIVQFVVVTKGAERIAEVSARFMLDALPGRQMSIEADVRANRIDQAEAAGQRERLREESQVMGALEGAMRFVKGDSIATLVIVVINLIGGLSIAVLVRGNSIAEASSHYLHVSIGEGIAAQIPSMLSAVAAGILVSRAGSAKSDIGAKIVAELAANDRSLLTASLSLASLAVLPGFPTAIMLPIAGAFALRPLAKILLPNVRSRGQVERPNPAQQINGALFVAEAHHTDQFICRLNGYSFGQLKGADFGNRVAKRRPDTVMRIGIRLPRFSFYIDDSLETGVLSLHFEGVEKMRLNLSQPTQMEDVVSTFEAFVIEHHVRTFTTDDVEDWLKECEAHCGGLIGAVRQIDGELLLKSLRRLLMERVSLSHPRPILAALAASASQPNPTSARLVDAARLAVCDRMNASSGEAQPVPQEVSDQIEAYQQSPETTVMELVAREKIAASAESQLRALLQKTGAKAIIVPDHLRYEAAGLALDRRIMLDVLSKAEFYKYQIK